jgi:hypothetical protein
MPNDRQMAGVGILRNPGVVMLWTSGYRIFHPKRGGKGILFEFKDPTEVEWWSEGRAATREEIIDSINGGLHHLVREAQLESNGAVEQLRDMVQYFVDHHIPKEAEAA